MNKRKSSGNLAAVQMKYHSSNPLMRYANQRFFKTVLKMLSGIDHGRILDAGCGEGIVLDLINELPGNHCGLEIDQERIHMALSYKIPFPFIQGNLHSLPFKEGVFDTVISLEVLEHVGDPQQALTELHRVTKKYILVSVPNEPWWRVGNMVRFKYLSDFGNTPEHINHWTLKSFKQFIETHFELIQVETPLLWTFILAQK